MACRAAVCNCEGARYNVPTHAAQPRRRGDRIIRKTKGCGFGKCDFVMANPPFNVDEIDADKIRRDPRLPFQLPGVNKQGKVSNGNYVWISYFDAYLNKNGRAGFVMSSQASSADGEEARVRRDLIKSGDVDVMIAIRGNFF
jgi:type I restriction enzyme M protein